MKNAKLIPTSLGQQQAATAIFKTSFNIKYTMQELKLGKLARPLAEARKDDAINRAALFVERLFERSLRSAPDILLVTPGNRKEYLRLVCEDYGRVMMFVPFPSLLPEEMKAGFEGRKVTVLGIDDLLSPIRTYQRMQQQAGFGHTEHILLNIGGMERRKDKFNPPANGVALKEENLIITRSSKEYQNIVHELVHFEDYEIFGLKEGKVQRIVREGRAVFAEEIFKWTNGSDFPFDLEVAQIEFLCRKLTESRFETAKGLIRRHGLAQVVKSIATLLRTTTLDEQLNYFPYASALMQLANAVNDPFLAFRISTEKLPETRGQIMNPLDFYRDELREHSRKSL